MDFNKYLNNLSTDLGFAGIYPSLSLNWHHDVMSGELTDFASGKVKKLIILLPPRSSKTVFCSVLLPSYLFFMHSRQRVLSMLGSVDRARIVGTSLRHVVDSDIWQSLKKSPLVGKRKMKQKFSLTDGSEYLSIPRGGVLAGCSPFDWVIFDEVVCNTREADSLTMKKDILEQFDLITSIKTNPEASVLVVSSWWRKNDYIGQLLANGGWRVLSIPAIADEDEEWEGGSGKRYKRQEGDPLWPEDMSLHRLQEIKGHLGNEFEGVFQQRPIYSVGRFRKHTKA